MHLEEKYKEVLGQEEGNQEISRKYRKKQQGCLNGEEKKDLEGGDVIPQISKGLSYRVGRELSYSDKNKKQRQLQEAALCLKYERTFCSGPKVGKLPNNLL